MPQEFDIKKLIVSDEDITFVEDYFKIIFNHEQKQVIRFWESVDIQACPGSGKTTTLAAKLIILARKMPPNFHQGICVITHTNTAVKEIKHKLGRFAEFYSSYPNHFGTIQSFVDKYLTIPFFKSAFSIRPRIVDEGTYDREIRRKPILRYSLGFFDIKNISVSEPSFNMFDCRISKNIHSHEPLQNPGISEEKWQVHYQKFLKAKGEMLKEGYIKYDEAYSLAFHSIRKNEDLVSIIKKRFPLVFIDEMQDMETHQSEIIRASFTGIESVIQKIGDINQSIYSRNNKSENKQWEPQVNVAAQLKQSIRLSDNIATIVRDICVSPQHMTGWENALPIKPAIIIYTDQTIGEVKNKFAEIILLNNLETVGECKCIGSRIGYSRLHINSYWNEFNRVWHQVEFSNLDSYIQQIEHAISASNNIKGPRRLYFEMICSYLKLNQFKAETGYYFTAFTLNKFLIENSKPIFLEINLLIAASVQEFKISGVSLQAKAKEIISLIHKHLTIEESAEASNFLKEPAEDSGFIKQENKIYTFEKNGKAVNLHFDTIHGVKGETHTATLYLECFNRIFDIGGKIVKFITSDENDRIKQRRESACKKQLPLAYVALTRATHFIALAINANRFTDDQKQYFLDNSETWQLFYV